MGKPGRREHYTGTWLPERPLKSAGERGRREVSLAQQEAGVGGGVGACRPLVCQWLAGDTPAEQVVRFGPGAGGGTVVEIEHCG